jgi:flagellar biosynthetic protein FliO
MAAIYYIKAILSLALVLGILYALNWWIRKYQKTPLNSQMKVVDRVGLAPGVSLVMVQIKDTQYIAGVSGKELTLLRKLSS